ncbi:MAG: UDP-N-acetylmuramoylalanyl-D-glutamyl-2, 6-diaminopimelate--D-alanyl-D-alanine ligase [Alphaproteobacteria bacterium]|nr:UDP-N-acetylmuramoylalanyl-D-glutamyl-2, 6-diaminopimelate--D-alanyl-D-alanine ligase [Alphaproteobacteria bacterium]|tara:strand:- start:1246 stop:2664 length:1419 start_codon:yes stop_codon:yes gene_type:complete
MSEAPLWTSGTAAQATGGNASGAWIATGVSIDSRTVSHSELFIALKGPTHDGHDHVTQALDGGAAAAVVSAPHAGVADRSRLLVVEDTQAALGALGVAARARFPGSVVGVTGSVGKTGTKEALKLALEATAPCHASASSLNNHWGVPLSLARLPHDAGFGVFEIGMNHPGEIRPLTAFVQPHIAVVTTVEAAHLEFLGTIEAVADAKAEIFEGLVPGGSAILNRDNDQFDRLAAVARECGAEVISFGFSETADVRAEKVALHPECICVAADIRGTRTTYKIKAPGRHWARNSLAVLATVDALGADLGLGALALGSLTPPDGRGRRHRVAGVDGHFTVIDDSYNASPASVRAGLEVLGAADTTDGGRRIAVLGDMLELGCDTDQLHAELSTDIVDNGVDGVFTCGAHMRHLFDALPAGVRAGHAETSTDLAPIVSRYVGPGDIVLIKGSFASAMARVVEKLLTVETQKRAVNG